MRPKSGWLYSVRPIFRLPPKLTKIVVSTSVKGLSPLTKGFRLIVHHKNASKWTVCRAESSIVFLNGFIWRNELSILSQPWTMKTTGMFNSPRRPFLCSDLLKFRTHYPKDEGSSNPSIKSFISTIDFLSVNRPFPTEDSRTPANYSLSCPCHVLSSRVALQGMVRNESWSPGNVVSIGSSDIRLSCSETDFW